MTVALISPRRRLGLGHVDGDHVRRGRRGRRTAPAPRRSSRPAPGSRTGRSRGPSSGAPARGRRSPGRSCPGPTMPERLAAQLDARELRPLPLAAAHRGVGGRGLAGEPEQQRERVLGGGDRVAGRRVDDGDPGPGRRLEVDVVDADAGPADDDEPRPGGDQLGVDLDLAADDERVVVGQDRRRSPSRGRPSCSSTSWWRAEELEALGASGSTTRILTRSPRRRTRAAMSACWAAATADAGRDVEARARSAPASSDADRGEDVVRRHRAEVAQPEDLALELALAAREHEAACA